MLVVAHTVTFAQRLREVFGLLEADLRIQVIFTAARGVHELRAPVLRISHGAGHIKPQTDASSLPPGVEPVPGMMSRQQRPHHVAALAVMRRIRAAAEEVGVLYDLALAELDTGRLDQAATHLAESRLSRNTHVASPFWRLSIRPRFAWRI